MNKVDAMRPSQTLQMSDSRVGFSLSTIACWRAIVYGMEVRNHETHLFSSVRI